MLSALNYLTQLLSPLNLLSFTLTSTGFYLTADKLYLYPLTAASRYFIYSYFSLVGFYFESLSFVINTSHPLFFTLVNAAKLKQTVLVREQRGLDYPVIYIILCNLYIYIYRFIGTFQIAGLYIFDDFHFLA